MAFLTFIGANRRKPFNRADFGRYGKQKMAVKNVFDHRFDHLHDHNLITIGV